MTDKRPPIVCLCGSTKFKKAFVEAYSRFTDAGCIVLSVGRFQDPVHKWKDEKHKEMLDELHLRKIDLCDYIYVLDVDKYIGESTEKEIAYANSISKNVIYLSKDNREMMSGLHSSHKA